MVIRVYREQGPNGDEYKGKDCDGMGKNGNSCQR